MSKLVDRIGNLTIVTSGVSTKKGFYVTMVIRGDELFDLVACQGTAEDGVKQHETYRVMAQIFDPVAQKCESGEITSVEEAHAACDIQEAKVLGKRMLMH